MRTKLLKVNVKGCPVDWHRSIFELIDMRSFSNLWYWIALAVLWSTTSHWVLGVPYDLVQRARRQGGQAAIDLEDMVRINTNRLLYIGQTSGLWLIGLVMFSITVLILLSFYYKYEFAQAVILLVFPMTIIWLLSLSTARVIRELESSGEDLQRRLHRHRIYTQIIGMISIFITALWGMLQNLQVSPLF